MECKPLPRHVKDGNWPRSLDNTAKTKRPQPRSNIKNDSVSSASKSSCIKNKDVEVEEHHRNLLLSKNKKHMSSDCNNVKLAIRNDKSKKKHNPKVKKSKKLRSNERLPSSKRRKPRTCLGWSPTGRIFDLSRQLIVCSEFECQSDSSEGSDSSSLESKLSSSLKRGFEKVVKTGEQSSLAGISHSISSSKVTSHLLGFGQRLSALDSVTSSDFISGVMLGCSYPILNKCSESCGGYWTGRGWMYLVLGSSVSVDTVGFEFRQDRKNRYCSPSVNTGKFHEIPHNGGPEETGIKDLFSSEVNTMMSPRNYIDLKDLNEPQELRRNRVDDLEPTIEEDGVVNEYMERVKTKCNFIGGLDNYPSDFMEDMGAYLFEEMVDVIVGEPFCKASCVEARRFDGIITIRDGHDNVTYQMVRSNLRKESTKQKAIPKPMVWIMWKPNIRAIRILLAIAAFYDYEIWQIDVKTAFLNGHLSEDVYMFQSEGLVDPKHTNKVAQNPDEPCVYLKASRSNVTFLILYVDDILLMVNNVTMTQEVNLGFRFWMENSKKGYTLMIEKPDYRKSQSAKTPSEVQRMQRVPYALAIVQSFILKYLWNTKDMVLVYGAKPKAEPRVSCYANASFQTDKDDIKSQMRYVFVLNGGAVDWKSAKQSTTAMSSTYAEYIAAAEEPIEAVYMRKFIDGLGSVVSSNKRPMEMLCDNEPAIAITNDSRILKGAIHV
nr:hypothetical protein [Tanacetum cinerariifolium]